MSKLIFKDLYLFSPSEKLAKKISFAPGRTMITSDAHDGTDRGKSVIMKALYHTMGADCYFEGKWDDSSKTYILRFCVDDDEYYIFRHNKLFKVFDGEKNLLFSVISRHELSERLSSITGFAVKLPPRERNSDDGYIQELEIASAVYNYLLYFVDQDYQNGSQFASFQHLGEYLDYKENVLYYHFGAFDDDYYMLVQEQDILLAEGASTEINDILKHEGFIDIKESVAEDLDTIRNSISENEKKLREVKKSLRKYGEIKKKINERYYALMLSDKNRFGLEGINAKSFENIKRTFSAGGSNNPLSTIIWYVNLIQLKHEFNPSAIDFPVVFDSPNNAETDETKKRQIYSYICERITENQLIVSGLGFSGDEILDSFDSIITLTNNKYELLCQKDYDANVSLLRELNNK